MPKYVTFLADNVLLPVMVMAQGLVFGLFASTDYANPLAPLSNGWLFFLFFVVFFAYGFSLAGISIVSADTTVKNIKAGRIGVALSSGFISFLFVVTEIISSLSARAFHHLTSPFDIVVESITNLQHPSVSPGQIIASFLFPIVVLAYVVYASYGKEGEVPKERKRKEHVYKSEPSLEEPELPNFVRRRREVPKATSKEGITLALGDEGPIIKSIDKILSMSIIGKPQRGKTSYLRFLVNQMLDLGYDVRVFDPHNSMSDLSGRLTAYARDTSAFIRESVALEQELESRKRELDDEGEITSPPLELVVDELPLVAESGEKVANILRRIILEGRKYKVNLIVAGHGLPASMFKDGKSMVRDAFSTRVFFDVTEAQARIANLSRDAMVLIGKLKGKAGVMVLDSDFEDAPQIVTFPLEVPSKEAEEATEAEVEMIIALHNEGKTNAQIPLAMGKSTSGGRFAQKVKRVVESYEEGRRALSA